MTLVYISLIINILIAGFFGVCLALNLNHRIIEVYGIDSTSRQILSCLYLTIALFSIWGLLVSTSTIFIVKVLFPFQICYKLLTFVIVRDKRNPIVVSNIIISVFLIIALQTCYWIKRYNNKVVRTKTARIFVVISID